MTCFTPLIAQSYNLENCEFVFVVESYFKSMIQSILLIEGNDPTTTSRHEDSPIGCSENNVACIAHSENLVDYVGGISDVEECRQLCNDEKACEYLTYYDVTSFPYSEACFLLKNCDDQVCFVNLIFLNHSYFQFSGSL